jgi:hypothetical protein
MSAASFEARNKYGALCTGDGDSHKDSLNCMFRNSGATSHRAPHHSHSIVAGTSKHLQIRDLFSGCAALTVNSTAKTFRLRTIDGDRCRKHLCQFDGSRRKMR